MKTIVFAVLLIPCLTQPSLAKVVDDDDWLDRFAPPAAAAVSSAQEAKARAAAESFLRVWLVEQDVDKAVSMTAIPVDEVVGGLWHVRDQAALETWRRKWLTMWFYPDHAVVAALGHGVTDKPGYARLAEKPSEVPGRPVWTATPAFEMKTGTSRVGAHAGKTYYAVKVTIKTAPRDEVWLFFVEINGRMKVILFESTVRS
ncbi:MAG: hypothetical protein HY923_07400 [Elusimicrobia bacterium]|nr:hypothetical protein [Elusimicrobiota bacterium]